MHWSKTAIRTLSKLHISAGVLAAVLGPGVVRADEPGLLGRFFRGGGAPAPAKPSSPASNASGVPYGRSTPTTPTSAPTPTPIGSNFDGVPAPTPAFGTVGTEVATPQPDPAAEASMPKLTPRSRVNRPITNAEPVLTRFSLGRSNDGSQFAMFLEIFADGTVLDSEGVHHLRPADIRPVLEAVQGADFSKIRGHSGAPPTDFIDHVQVIVFDRRLGRLTAHPFSYSGNPQGCDAAIRHLHSALEGLQVKLSRPPQPAVSASAPAAATPPPVSTARADSSVAPAGMAPNSAIGGDSSKARSLPLPTLPNPSAGSAITPNAKPAVGIIPKGASK